MGRGRKPLVSGSTKADRVRERSRITSKRHRSKKRKLEEDRSTQNKRACRLYRERQHLSQPPALSEDSPPSSERSCRRQASKVASDLESLSEGALACLLRKPHVRKLLGQAELPQTDLASTFLEAAEVYLSPVLLRRLRLRFLYFRYCTLPTALRQ